MNILIKRGLYLPRLLVFLLFPCFSAQSIEVIVHPSVTLDQVSSSHIRRIFTMRNKQWNTKLPITVFVRAANNEVHDAFCIQELEVFPYQLEKIWRKLLFSGLGEPPQVLDSEQDMIEMVRTTPGAIGYVSKLHDLRGVKIITVGNSNE